MDIKNLAEFVDEMPMHPYLTICHVIVCTLNARSDLGLNSIFFSRKHPLACWLSTLISIFSSTMLANFLLNEPVISALSNTRQVLWASFIWYIIFYSPFDLVFKTLNFTPIKLCLYCIYEIHNCKQIYQGILHSAKIFPDCYLIMALIGIVKGNGPGFTRLFERLIRGSWSMNVLEFMYPSYNTKVSTFVSIVFIINRHTEWLMISQSFIFFCVVSMCIYSRLSALLLDLNDPFTPFENIICLLIFGGIWDALQRALVLDLEQARLVRASQQQANLRSKAMQAAALSRAVPVKMAKVAPLAHSAQRASLLSSN